VLQINLAIRCIVPAVIAVLAGMPASDRVAAHEPAEIEQRLKFDRLSKHQEPSRREVIDELRADRRKLRYAQNAGIAVPDAQVDAAYANMARRMNWTPEQLSDALVRSGIDPDTLKRRIRADIAAQLLQRRAPPSAHPPSGPD